MAKEGGELPGLLISSFLGDDLEADYRSYSQLLAGTMALPASPILPKSAFWSFSGGEDQEQRHGSSPLFPLLDSPPLFAPHPGVLAKTHLGIAPQIEDGSWFSAKGDAFEETQMGEAQKKEVFLSRPKQQAFSLLLDDPSDDGYSWKKYGQKMVKASECPRSYFKCTHPKCTVKKKVERSLDGHVASILYNGEHNHPRPSPGKRCRDNGSGRLRSDLCEESGSEYSGDKEDDGFEEQGGEGSDAEFCSKRRRGQVIGRVELSSSKNTVTKPKIIVQTTSEVDLLDDGYKWRKYGQKVVKGKLNPRSYYKCTNPGCNVRKHVERDSTNPNAVITTYEGKHNHNVPAPKSSGHKLTYESFS